MSASPFDQDVWWKTGDGLIHLIDDLEDSHRANIAAYLVNNAARYHLRKRMWEKTSLWLTYEQAGWEAFERGSWGPVTEDPPTREELVEGVRQEQEKGEHLDWIRGTVLFQRMIRGLTELRPGTVAS